LVYGTSVTVSHFVRVRRPQVPLITFSQWPPMLAGLYARISWKRVLFTKALPLHPSDVASVFEEERRPDRLTAHSE